MKKPTTIHDAIDRCLAEITSPEEILPIALARVARLQNLSPSEFELQCLATAILNAKGESIDLDLDPPCAFGDTEEEMQSTLQGVIDKLSQTISELGDDVTDAISEAIPDVLADVAERMGDSFSEGAIEHALQLRKAHSNRAEAVRRLWGPVIAKLDFLRHIVLEWSFSAAELRVGAYAKPNTAFALSKLVERAYEVVGEVATLAEHGYADGALARWRSVHEICVIAMFLSTRSDRCALMYLSHHRIEELRLLDVDTLTDATGSTNANPDRHVRDLRMKKAAMVNEFGAAFANDYGWASIELGRARTTFRDLEALVELDVLRRGYQQANSTIHGGALAALTRISLGTSGIDSINLPPAYGCEVAIKYASASLSVMVAELCLETENADLLAMNMVVRNCAAEIFDLIKQGQKEIAGDSPRARMLARKVALRQSRTKARRGYPRIVIRRESPSIS
ncbi:hypothetical protein D3C71_1125070 [compost metagenome]